MSVEKMVVFFVACSEFFLGIWVNGSTMLLFCLSWVKRRKISFPDFIMLNLTLSRIILQGILILDSVLVTFYPHLHEGSIAMQIIDSFWTFFNNLSICLMACLSVLYCLKIASFSHHVFLWLKWRVSRVMIWILLGSGLYCFFSIIALLVKFDFYSNMKFSENNTAVIKRKKTDYYVLHVLGALWSVIPFSLCLVSSGLLILSLMKHTQQMQQYAPGTRDLSARAHIKATKIIFSSLLLFTGYIFALFLGMSSHFFPNPKLAGLTRTLIFAAYPSIQTFILILENPKLKQAFLEMFHVKKWKLKFRTWKVPPKS